MFGFDYSARLRRFRETRRINRVRGETLGQPEIRVLYANGANQSAEQVAREIAHQLRTATRRSSH